MKKYSEVRPLNYSTPSKLMSQSPQNIFFQNNHQSLYPPINNISTLQRFSPLSPISPITNTRIIKEGFYSAGRLTNFENTQTSSYNENNYKTPMNNNLNFEENKLIGRLLEEKNKAKLKEDELNKTIDFLNSKLQTIINENEKLNNLLDPDQIKKIDNLESKIFIIINENNKLNDLLKKEYEKNDYLRNKTNAYEQKLNELGKNEEERNLFNLKMDELQKKLYLIFEDNDKLSSVIKEREEDFSNLQKVYEREVQLRSDLENKIDEIMQKNENFMLNENLEQKYNEMIYENNRLNELLVEKNSHYHEIETKIEMVIQENNKLNEIIKNINTFSTQEDQNDNQIEQLQSKIKSLNDENLKLTEILTSKLQEINELNQNNNNNNINECKKKARDLEFKVNSFQNNEYELIQAKSLIKDLESKIEVLLAENSKLHSIFEEKLKDFQIGQEIEEKCIVLLEENKKLNNTIREKNEAEIFWKNKFSEIENKIKILFFQTNH